MANVNKLKSDFDNAKRALMLSLFESAENRNPAYIKMSIERMGRIFNQLLLSTLEQADQMPDILESLCPQEFLCAHAINTGDDWSGSRWQIAYINGEAVPDLDDAPTVREFTRQMIADGWQAATPPGERQSAHVTAPNGQPVYELYFRREVPSLNTQDLIKAELFMLDPNSLSYTTN
jgi:hypothetical protein